MPLLWFVAQAASLEEVWTAVDSHAAEHTIIEAQAEARATQVGQALGAFGPRVMVSGSWTVNEFEASFDPASFVPEALLGAIGDTEPIIIQAKEAFSGTATIVQPLLVSEAITGLQAARASARASEAERAASLSDLRLLVASSYWTVLLARDREAILQQSLESARRHRDLVQGRVALGVARPTDGAAAEIDVLRAERDQLDAAASRRRAELELARLTGMAPEVSLDRPATRALPYVTASDAIARTAGTPRVLAAEHRADAAGRLATGSALGWVPTLSARFTEAFSENTGFTGKMFQWQAAISADWQLWDGGGRLARVHESHATAAMADASARREREVAETDVARRWSDLDAARRSLEVSTQERALAEDSLRIAEQAYALGGLTEIELADARLRVEGARLAVAGAEMSVDMAALALLHATGDL